MELLTLCLFFPLIFLALILRYLFIRYKNGLRHLPGPFLASISSLDRIWSCAAGHQMLYHISLHNKYGLLVRIGPEHVSISDPKYISTIYGINTKFYKVRHPAYRVRCMEG